MQYIVKTTKGITSFTGIFTIHKDSPDAVNIVLGTSLESVRKSMINHMGKALKKIKPHGDSLSWKTKLGEFAVYKEYEYDDYNQYGSKFRTLYLYVELDARKFGKEVETKTYFIRKEPNPECEDYEECDCGKGLKAMYEVKIQNKKELRCIECKKFHGWMNRISKKLDKEKEQKKQAVTV